MIVSILEKEKHKKKSCKRYFKIDQILLIKENTMGENEVIDEIAFAN